MAASDLDKRQPRWTGDGPYNDVTHWTEDGLFHGGFTCCQSRRTEDGP